MARIRSVHPGLFTDEAFMCLTPWARILLVGLLTEADDNGVFAWKPVTLKVRLLPADHVDVNPLLAELQQAGFLRQYDVRGSLYGAVRNFCRWQRPERPNTVHPLPDAIAEFVALGARGRGRRKQEAPPPAAPAPAQEASPRPRQREYPSLELLQGGRAQPPEREERPAAAPPQRPREAWEEGPPAWLEAATPPAEEDLRAPAARGSGRGDWPTGERQEDGSLLCADGKVRASRQLLEKLSGGPLKPSKVRGWAHWIDRSIKYGDWGCGGVVWDGACRDIRAILGWPDGMAADWGPLAEWCHAGLDFPTIERVLREGVASMGEKPITSLAFFQAPMAVLMERAGYRRASA
jgi:hypothetical protein